MGPWILFMSWWYLQYYVTSFLYLWYWYMNISICIIFISSPLTISSGVIYSCQDRFPSIFSHWDHSRLIYSEKVWPSRPPNFFIIVHCTYIVNLYLQSHSPICKLEVWGSSGLRLLAGGPSGLLTSSFASFGRSGRVTHSSVIWSCVSLWIVC